MSIEPTTSGPGLTRGFPFSLASAAGDTCFVSGMPALNPEGKYQEGTFVEEVTLAWHNIATITEAAGYSVKEIVYVQCVVADIADYGELKTRYTERALVAMGVAALATHAISRRGRLIRTPREE